MKEYKIVKPESMWAYKDATIEEIFNQHASQGWRVISVGYGGSGNLLKAVLDSNKNQIERYNNIMSALTNLQEALNRLTTATDTAVTVLNTPHPSEEAIQAAADLVNAQATRLESASDSDPATIA